MSNMFNKLPRFVIINKESFCLFVLYRCGYNRVINKYYFNANKSK